MSSTPPDIFLSYNREDQITARRFAESFERAGFSVWWDATLRSGEDYDQVTEKALKEAKAVVVLWSKKSVDSRWVRAEATQADRNKTLVPVMIEPCERPIMFELKQTADLCHWKGDGHDKAWLAFVNDIKQFVQRGAAPAASLSAPVSIARKKLKPVFMLEIAAFVVLIATIGIWALLRPHQDTAASGTSTAPLNAAAPKPGASLAVLPFVNLSSDAEQEYFSDGLSEEILNQLAQIKDLSVTARTSSFSFKGKNEDLRVIGEKLGVGNILEGSVRKADKQLRITAQLINAATGTHLWSHTYDKELTDVFAIQEEIAMAVSAALSVTLDVGAMSRANGGTTNLDAYDKFLRARKFGAQGGVSGYTQAAQLYRDSVRLDAGFSLAWFGLYKTLIYLQVQVPEQYAAIRAEMNTVSERMETLSPNAWWTQSVRADQLARQRKWQAAGAASDLVIATAPSSADGVLGTSVRYLWAVGRLNDAVVAWERMRQADPLSLSTSSSLQMALDIASRPAEANAEYERSQTLEGDHAVTDFRAVQRMWRQKQASPAEITAKFHSFMEHEIPKMKLNQILAGQLNDKALALAAVREAFQDPANNDPTRTMQIFYYANHYGDKDLALAALRRYFELGAANYFNLWWPSESGFRSDPRFKELLKEFGLVDYFRQSGNWGDFCKPLGSDDFECH